jgi:hypothetical protein
VNKRAELFDSLVWNSWMPRCRLLGCSCRRQAGDVHGVGGRVKVQVGAGVGVSMGASVAVGGKVAVRVGVSVAAWWAAPIYRWRPRDCPPRRSRAGTNKQSERVYTGEPFASFLLL